MANIQKHGGLLAHTIQLDDNGMFFRPPNFFSQPINTEPEAVEAAAYLKSLLAWVEACLLIASKIKPTKAARHLPEI